MLPFFYVVCVIHGKNMNTANDSFEFEGMPEIGTDIDIDDAAPNTNIVNAATAKKRDGTPMILGDLHYFEAGVVWNHLIEEAKALSASESNNPIPMLHVMEVGMHRAGQCLDAARQKFTAHCVEPSPQSVSRINGRILKAPAEVRRNIKFYQMAASDTSGGDLQFMSEGGTGDHVGGGVDVWTMTKTDESDADTKKDKMVTVKSVAIDDIISNKVKPTTDYANGDGDNGDGDDDSRDRNVDHLFLLKVDTQGHEPSVFSGLKKSIAEHKIDFIMTEYWPKGIDFMNDAMGPETECNKGVEILQLMIDAGYTLYTMKALAHPKAPVNEGMKIIRDHNHSGGEVHTPLDDLKEHCMWFYRLERDPMYLGNDDDEYKMGYWTDILAVSPHAALAKEPVSRTGKVIAKYMESN